MASKGLSRQGRPLARAISYQGARKLKRATTLKYPTVPAIFTACWAFVLYLFSRFKALINLMDETVIIINPSPIPKFMKTNVNKSI